jgi:glucan 1,3-beta-glucosidase
MREGALPSPVNQTRAIHEVLALAKREGYRVNLIEAYDQPWKRRFPGDDREGTVGGHWGLYDSYQRTAKFAWGGVVSNHPEWRWQAAGGIALAAAIFAAAFLVRRRAGSDDDTALWPPITGIAIVSGTLIGWTVADVPLESLTVGDWIRSLAWSAVAVLAPIVGAAALAGGKRAPTFAEVIGRSDRRPRDRLVLALGLLLVALGVLAVQAALVLVFDPRYRDFPFAPLTGAVIPFVLLVGPWAWRPKPPAAEAAMAATLVGAAIYVAFNEGIANWQALWFAASLAALALTLAQARDAPD